MEKISDDNKFQLSVLSLLIILMAIGYFGNTSIETEGDTPTHYYGSPRVDTSQEPMAWDWANNKPIYKAEWDSTREANMKPKNKKKVQYIRDTETIEDIVEEYMDKYKD